MQGRRESVMSIKFRKVWSKIIKGKDHYTRLLIVNPTCLPWKRGNIISQFRQQLYQPNL